MRGTRKQRQKRNIFSDDEDDFNEENISNKKAQGEENKLQYDIYDPAKLEENEMYINKEEKSSNIFAFQDQSQESQPERQPIPKEKKQRKKKNIFGDSSEEQQNQQQVTKLPLQTENEKKAIERDEGQSLTQSQGDNQGTQQVKRMINQKIQKGKEAKEVSFQLAINQVGKNIEERKKLFMRTLDPEERAVCYFKRIPTGFSEVYHLLGEDERPLIFCENQRGSIGGNYYFSLTKEMDKNNEAYLGKLRGNASGSAYQLYNDGQQPGKKLDRSQWRTSLAYIEYEDNFMGRNGPRKFQVVLPNFEEYDEDSFKLGENETLGTFKSPIIKTFKNKQPKWNQRLKSFALNFGGRVKKASIKNFILVEDSNQPEVSSKSILIFGKVDDNTFSLEFTYPLSLMQAFGIVVSQFDFKIKCQ